MIADRNKRLRRLEKNTTADVVPKKIGFTIKSPNKKGKKQVY